MIDALVLLGAGVAAMLVADHVDEAGPRAFLQLAAILVMLIGLGRIIGWALTTSLVS